MDYILFGVGKGTWGAKKMTARGGGLKLIGSEKPA
jgi:hypothetical protein